MSRLDERIAQIKTELVGATDVKVLLVEGTDDVDAMRIFLDRKFSGWEKAWHIQPAGGKRQVLDMLRKESNWLGLVDRDEWSVADVARHAGNHANLLVLPRFCLESYLIDPTELWQAFPEKQRQKIAGGLPQLHAEIFQNKAEWLRHAALWHVIRPLWRNLRDMGFPDDVLPTPPVPSDEALLAKLTEWHTALDAAVILSKVKELEVSLAVEPDASLCAQWIYSKKFYPEVVHRTLDMLLGQKPAKDRRISILRTLPIPADLGPLWQRMGL